MMAIRIGPGCHTAVAIRPVVAGADRPVVAGADAGDVASSFCVALSLLARLICSSFSCVNATRVAGNLHWCVGRGFGRERHCGFGCEHPL